MDQRKEGGTMGEKKEMQMHKNEAAGVRGSVISGEAGIQGDITRATGADRSEGVYVNLNNGWMERRKAFVTRIERKEKMEL